LRLDGTLTNGGQVQINGILDHEGGSISSPPSYGANSILHYGAAGTRSSEWSPGATSGPGYPANVDIANDAVSMGTLASPLQMGGNLNVSGRLKLGSSGQPLKVLGNVNAADFGGIIELGVVSGGDLVAQG